MVEVAEVLLSRETGSELTVSFAQLVLCNVVNAEEHGPVWHISHDEGPEPAVHPPDSFVSPDNPCRAEETVVHGAVWSTDCSGRADAR